MTYPLVFRGDGVVGPGSTYVQCHEDERAGSYSPAREGSARRKEIIAHALEEERLSKLPFST